ncbi:MAG: transketolase [Candidatus Komeilibacteria bacterium]|jgi:transketolase|nr:transketolase [Candidatus Komeilibacteria bacterium]MBT4448025.1 transketolase [Candidatus Komeilibacteria bacterium]
MRIAFVETITKLAIKDKSVWLLTGDLGFSVFEDFANKFPDRYLNVGVAEQNMMGIAAGLAMAGKKVFVYSISTFSSMRAFEQIRNDICYQNLPVCIIGGGSTFSYSSFGCTHFALEDIGILRILPNMTVVNAGDPMEVEVALDDYHKNPRPFYLRIAKRGEPVVHKNKKDIKINKATQVKEGEDISIFASGKALQYATEAVEELKIQGINAELLSFHTVKPLDEEAIIKSAKQTKNIITIEEHLIHGGLGTAVSEVVAQNALATKLKCLAVADEFPAGVGSEQYMLDRYSLNKDSIIAEAKKMLS